MTMFPPDVQKGSVIHERAASKPNRANDERPNPEGIRADEARTQQHDRPAYRFDVHRHANQNAPVYAAAYHPTLELPRTCAADQQSARVSRSDKTGFSGAGAKNASAAGNAGNYARAVRRRVAAHYAGYFSQVPAALGFHDAQLFKRLCRFASVRSGRVGAKQPKLGMYCRVPANHRVYLLRQAMHTLRRALRPTPVPRWSPMVLAPTSPFQGKEEPSSQSISKPSLGGCG